MSLYNLLFDKNPLAPLLLKILEIDQPGGKYKSGRFRDTYLNAKGTKIILLTRNGGNNREGYFPKNILKHPNYLTDYDDSFDSTYCYIEFSVPGKFQEALKKLAPGKEPGKLHEKFAGVVKNLEEGKVTPETKKAEEMMEKILKKMESGETVIEI